MILAFMFLISFSDPAQSASVDWNPVNDGVMGGLSRSALELTDEGTGVFHGELSLENNGGFASVRSRLREHDVSSASGLQLRVRGDGRRYQLRLRTDNGYDGVAYRAEFEAAAGEWTEVTLDFEDFLPTFRGRILRDVPALDTSSLRQIGFLLADKKPGAFRLEIDYVKAVLF